MEENQVGPIVSGKAARSVTDLQLITGDTEPGSPLLLLGVGGGSFLAECYRRSPSFAMRLRYRSMSSRFR